MKVHLARSTKCGGRKWLAGPAGRKRKLLRGNTCPVCQRDDFASRANMTHHLRAVHKRSITEWPELSRRAATPRKFGKRKLLGKRKPHLLNGISTEMPVQKPSRAGLEDENARVVDAILTTARVIQSVKVGMRL
jgi:hypothetical protein